MKEGWEYKKLGELGTFQRGGGFLKSDYVENGFPCIHYGQIHTKFGVSVDRHLTSISKEKAHKSKIASKGDIIIAITSEDVEGSCKCTAWMGNYDVAVGAHTAIFKHNQNPLYISYVLRSKRFNEDKTKYAHGFKVVEIKPDDISKIAIPVAPISIQEYIVSELDLLSRVIEKHKAQLEELDKLAQSIFYDMFGDPVTNEKGWEMKKLFEISNVGTGSTPSRNNDKYYEEGTIPWVKTTEVQNCDIFDTEEKITEFAIKETNCKVYPIGTLLMAMYGQGKTRGQLAKLRIEAATNQACAAIVLNNGFSNPYYIYEYLHLQYENIRDMARGGNQLNLNLNIVKAIPIYLPPLSLQQEFAAKIEAIEAMKAKVRQSLKEAETLFNERMNCYFG